MRSFSCCASLIAVGLALLVTMPSEAAEPTLPIKAGIIGLDAHASPWSKIFNNPDAKGELADLTIVAGFPAGSPDIPKSLELRDRGIETFKQLGIELVDSIPALLDKVDVVLVLSIDGRAHLEQARQVIEAGKPVYVDKPMAASYADARRIFELAKKHNVPCFSSSSLRFSPHLQAILKENKVGAIIGCDAHSPCATEPHHPDFFWYGIHGVEPLFTVMGTGCVTVTRVHTQDTDVAVGVWKDGRIGTFRGHRTGPHTYGATIFGQKAIVETGKFEGYEPLLVEIVKFFKTGVAPIDPNETLEILAFMEAADKSKQQGGKPVSMASVMK